MPLLGEAVTLAGPIKGVTLNVATARGAVHSSGEVVFRRWNGFNLAMAQGPPSVFLVVRFKEGSGWARISPNLTAGAFGSYSPLLAWQRSRCFLLPNGTYRRLQTRHFGML